MEEKQQEEEPVLQDDPIQELELKIAELNLELENKKKEIRELVKNVNKENGNVISKDILKEEISSKIKMPDFVNKYFIEFVITFFYDILDHANRKVKVFGHDISLSVNVSSP